MRIFNLNRVSPGEAITAQAWNALVECCLELQSELQRRRLSVGDGLELSESSCGTTLSLDVGDYGEDGAAGQEHPFKVTARIVRAPPEHEEARIAAGFVNGGMDGTRTRDLLRDRQAL